MQRRTARTRTALLAGAVAVGLVLSACSGGAPQGDPNAPIEVWTRSQDDTKKVYEKIFKAFTDKTGIPVNYNPPPFNDFDKRVQERAQSKDLPDLVITDTGSLGPYRKQGFVVEVDRNAFAGQGDLVERAWNNGKTADGKYFAVPFSTQAQVLLVRKDWREKLGKPVPKTWDELAALANDFTTKDPDGNGDAKDTFGIVAPGSTDRGYLAWWAANYIWQAGGDILSESGGEYKVAVNSAQTTQAVNWLKGLFCDTKVTLPNSLTMVTNDAHNYFEQGKAGIYLTGPYMFTRFDKAPGKDKYEVIPSPAGPSGSTVLGEGEVIYQMAGSAKTAEQKKLAEFLVSPEAQQLGMKPDAGQRPVVRLSVNKNVDVKSVYNDPRWDTVAKVYAENARPFPNVPNFQPFRQQTAETLNSLFAKCGSDVSAELTKLAGNLDKELKSQKAAQ
ncbi:MULTISPECIES: ABC transporter substrate-binding protein [unclassified Crossiella]|uniref:ABC transporter substrate-binding protein n=1 Tax=unclassified Crossiella TaxID=2620835 RepID=UPI001FFF344B|nr:MULTISPECIES: sugar ABC transporter substrate-binding protein [unclassified Crossiella]MCK2240377.1 sugar ABC transporter substrate-binding protein [Crossiella sp. S99.2]MCK2253171.1 sugar ABC transporter substrate-binding protein [Crossiella sp. S99.1]